MKVRNAYFILIAIFCLGSLTVFGVFDYTKASPFHSSTIDEIRPGMPSSSPTRTPVNNNNDKIGDDMDSFGETRARLKILRETGNLNDIIFEQKNIESKWGEVGGISYGLLYRDLLAALTTDKIIKSNSRVLDLSQDFVQTALAHADSFDLETEWFLLMYLRYPTREIELSNDEIIERNSRVELWLHLLRRLEKEKDPEFDPNDLPTLNVTPPDGSNGIAGMSPESIQDPELRENYKKAIRANSVKTEYFSNQVRLRQNESSIIDNGIKYISLMYSQNPFNSTELRSLLEKYDISKALRNRIIERTDELIKK